MYIWHNVTTTRLIVCDLPWQNQAKCTDIQFKANITNYNFSTAAPANLKSQVSPAMYAWTYKKKNTQIARTEGFQKKKKKMLFTLCKLPFFYL